MNGKNDTAPDWNQPIFWVDNKHAVSAGEPPHIDGNRRKRYHGYFENELGEQFIFVFDYEVQEGFLYMGDAGWDRVFTVKDGVVRELILSDNESLWLLTCWNTAFSLK